MKYDFQELEKERDQISQTLAIARVMENCNRQVDNQNKFLWRVVIAYTVLLAVMVACMVGFMVRGQQMLNDAVTEALYSVAEIGVTEETTTTTTTEVTQDTGEGSGNNVYQAGEGSVYNEDGES